MSWTLRIQPRARLELLEAAGWYAEEGGGSAAKFTDAVDATLLRIRENPFQYQVAYGELRRAIIHGFPYGVIYAVGDNEVSILGVVHGRRNPRRWQSRRP